MVARPSASPVDVWTPGIPAMALTSCGDRVPGPKLPDVTAMSPVNDPLTPLSLAFLSDAA